jgi:hypothetical protein
MNNTRTRTLAIVAVLIAATLVVGLTVSATSAPSAFAGGKKDGQDKYVKGRHANGKDNSSGNGNTNTIQVLKQNAKTGGKFSIVEQNGQNVICTHPSTTSPHSTDDAAIVIGFNPPGSCTSQTNVPPLLGRAEATR